MKKLFCMISFIFILLIGTTVSAKELPRVTNVDLNKAWTINFNFQLKPESVNENNVYILDENGNKIEVSIELQNSDKSIFLKPTSKYISGEAYKIVITKDVRNIKDFPLKEEMTMNFTATNKIILGWNYIYQKSSNQVYYNSVDDYINNSTLQTGMNTISPTWFILQGNSTNASVSEKGDKTYVERAHNNGYEVSPTFSSFPTNGETLTQYASRINGILTNSQAVQNVIKQIKDYAIAYNVDSINVDFEGMGKINKDPFSEFVKELTVELSQCGIKTSVDVIKPVLNSAYSECYDIPKLASYADYVIFMGYDEHWGGDTDAGSVGSYNWVEDGIKDILASGVSKDKLVLGVPFYMRDFAVVEANPSYGSIVVTKNTKLYMLPNIGAVTMKDTYYGYIYKGNISLTNGWYEVEYNGGKCYIQQANAQVVNGGEFKRVAVGWDTKSMKDIIQIENDSTNSHSVYYDTDAKQDVLIYYKMDSAGKVRVKHMIWLENDKSMSWRVALINKYDLKGLAAWQLYEETNDIWKVINNVGK